MYEAQAWWHANRPDAPGAIEDEIGRASTLLAEFPLAGRIDDRFGHESIRRLYLQRIRYFLFYRVEDDQLTLLAFWHTSRASLLPIDV